MQPFLKALPAVATSALALVAFLTLVVAWLFLALRVRRNKHLLDALEKLPPGQRLKALQAEMGHVTPPKNFSAAQWLKWQTRRLYVSGGAITVGVVAITLLAAYAFRYGYHPDPASNEPHGPAHPATSNLISLIPSTVQEKSQAPFVCPKNERGIYLDARSRPVDIAGVNFDEASCKLSQPELEYLENVAELLRLYPDINISVEGFTAAREAGSSDADDALSDCRARLVESFLGTQEVDLDHLRAFGHGSNNPIADNATPEGRCQNRRVELQILPNGSNFELQHSNR